MIISVGLEVMFESRLRIISFPVEKLGGERMLAFQREKMHTQRFQELGMFWEAYVVMYF